jgi:hypothetical protein
LSPPAGDCRPEFEADVARFFDMTRGHVPMAGRRTISAVPQFAHADRTLVTLRSGDDPQAMLDRFPGRIVYIGGARRCGTSTPPSSATGTSRGCRTTDRPIAGSDSARHGPLQAPPWDEAAAPRGDPAHCRFGPGGYEPGLGCRAHPLDEPKPPIDRLHNLYVGAGGVIWALRHLAQPGAIEAPPDGRALLRRVTTPIHSVGQHPNPHTAFSLHACGSPFTLWRRA